MRQDGGHQIIYETTTSLCPDCLRTLPAQIIIKDKAVYLTRYCDKHGEQLELLEADAAYHFLKRDYDKPGTFTKLQTEVRNGCPFDCGLCPQHQQHTCIALIEVTQDCDLHCPICYANAGTGEPLGLDEIEAMMDFYQVSELGRAEILQISGGEPTTHPAIIEIIKMAQTKHFKYIMLNTNGLRIAQDLDFVKQLQKLRGGFEIYLQFDGFSQATHRYFRGQDLKTIKAQAIKNLTDHQIPVTLVATVAKGINDHEVGALIDYGIATKYIRGINFQPVAFFGRYPELDRSKRISLSGLLRQIERSTKGRIRLDDFIPLPCNVERVALTYLYRKKEGFIPITRTVNIKKYLALINNTFAFYLEDLLKKAGRGMIRGDNYCECLKLLKDLKKFNLWHLGLKSKAARVEFVDQNTFRISVSSFVDAYNFEQRSIQKECVQVITPDFKKIPFSAYNLFYRDGCEHDRILFDETDRNAI